MFKVIITVIIRDKKAWTIILVNLLLFLMGLMLATKADSASYNTFLVSFMPTLLIIGVASVLAEVRGSLGASRISIYYLPITPSKLISNLTLAGVVFGLLSVTLLAGVTQKIITGSIDWQSLSRLSITMALAIQAAVLASVLFFESKRDIGKGILAGIAMFILTWPILLGSEWIRQKGLPVYLAASALTAIMIFYVTVHADKKLQSERFA